MTKIYFAGSITGGRENFEFYRQIIDYLKEYGEVLTEYIGDKELSALGENLSDPEIHDRDTDLLNMADVVVAEVTTPSHGVGFEIGICVGRNRGLCEKERQRVLCLHRPSDGRRLSPMIAGCEGITVGKYAKIEEARRHIDDFFRKR